MDTMSAEGRSLTVGRRVGIVAAALMLTLALLVQYAPSAYAQVSVSFPSGQESFVNQVDLPESVSIDVFVTDADGIRPLNTYFDPIVANPFTDPPGNRVDRVPFPSSFNAVTFTVPSATPIGQYRVLSCMDDFDVDTGTTEGCSGPFTFSQFQTYTVRGIEVDPGSGLAGSGATVTGTGFRVTEYFGDPTGCDPVAVTFNGISIGSVAIPDNEEGPFDDRSITLPFTVPDLAPGTYTITATQGEVDANCPLRSFTTTFTVTTTPVDPDPDPDPDTVLSLDPEEGTVESETEATGTGYLPGVPVVLRTGDGVLAIVAASDVSRGGSFTATFDIPVGTPGGQLEVEGCQRCDTRASVSATAIFDVLPRVFVDREVGRSGEVVIVTGDGFPADGTAQLRWSAGIGITTVTADTSGEFTQDVLLFRRDIVGPRELIAEVQDGSEVPPTATTDLLVVPRTLSPPDFISRG